MISRNEKLFRLGCNLLFWDPIFYNRLNCFSIFSYLNYRTPSYLCGFKLLINVFCSCFQSQAHLAYQELQKSPALRPIMPQGSMYMMIQIKMSLFPKFENELQFISQLCNEQSVLCIPGKVPK